MSRGRDLSGQKFGRLTVLNEVEPTRRPNGKPRKRWKCLCECGVETVVFGENLTSGNTRSCGCLQKDIMIEHETTHGATNTRLYGVWCAIKRRCYTDSTYEYQWYGARGIGMCDAWKNSFREFKDWAMNNGYDPEAPRGECTIDRIDVDGDYSPENCRWVPQIEQMNNIRTNRVIECNGEKHTLAEWSRITGIPSSKIRRRIVIAGWTPERALNTN